MKITKKMAKQLAKAMREAMDEAEDNRVLGNKELAYYYNGRKSAFEEILRSAEGDWTLSFLSIDLLTAGGLTAPSTTGENER